jgi:hypothetical protein
MKTTQTLVDAHIDLLVNVGRVNEDGTVSILAHAGSEGFCLTFSRADAEHLAAGLTNALKGGYNEPNLGRRPLIR